MVDVSVAPAVDFWAPVIQAAAVAVVPVIIGWIALVIKQKTGFDIEKIKIDNDQTMLDRLKSAAATGAGQLVAEDANNLRNQSIKIDDPRVAAVASKVISAVPEAASRLGATPQRVAAIVVGEIGKLQAQQTQPTPPPPAALT